MIHLRSVERKADLPGPEAGFPFSVPAVARLTRLAVDVPLTFLVGANGSGKSTILEGLAAAAGLPTVGSEETGRDGTLAAQRRLAKCLRLVWEKRTHKGFFLRAEDFFGFTKRLSVLRTELAQRLTELDEEYKDRSAYAKALATGPMRSSIAELEHRYGKEFDGASHGESFLKLFQGRFVPGGLYLLDEPEAPLAPRSQLALLAMLGDMITEKAQFIIATHSPILLAFPGARIFSFDVTPVAEVPYGELEHVTLTRDFLAAPERFLRHLRAPETPPA